MQNNPGAFSERITATSVPFTWQYSLEMSSEDALNGFFIYSLLLHHPNQRTLIFTNSIHSVRRLTPMLQNLNIPAHALHSQMAQKARMRSIEKFSSGKFSGSVLVATDVAARGLDIGGVQLVIHYHLPRTADMYVHRSGRTARAAASGSSILLCCPEEVVGTRRLVAKVHARNALAGEGKKSKKDGKKKTPVEVSSIS